MEKFEFYDDLNINPSTILSLSCKKKFLLNLNWFYVTKFIKFQDQLNSIYYFIGKKLKFYRLWNKLNLFSNSIFSK